MDDTTESQTQSAIERYQDELAAIDVQRGRLQRQDGVFAKLRASLFFLALVFFLVGYGFDGVRPAAWIAWIALCLFVVAVVANEPIRDRLAETQKHRRVFQRLIARLQRDWDALGSQRHSAALTDLDFSSRDRDAAADLDLLGEASLFQLVSVAETAPGIRTLAHWVAGPALSAVAIERRIAAAALAPLRDRRLRFYTLARQVAESSGDPDRFVEWVSGAPWLDQRRWLRGWATVTTVLAMLLLIALLGGVLGWLPLESFRNSLVALGLLTAINLFITTVFLGPAHAIFAVAMSNRRAVDDYQELFAAAGWLPESQAAGFLKRIRDTMIDGPRSASTGLHQLRRIAWAGGLRQSAATFLVYLPLQCLVLWDVHVLARLERWQAQHRRDAVDWFESLGQLESLMSIAALWDEYPDWTQPQWQTDDLNATVEAVALGHPLLPDQARVCNDVRIGPPGTFLLVTGSNMSGKSTLLRSVGLNTALAAIGAPVCASRLSLPSLELATSIRVRDDVSQGVSFYIAELNRLKSVVDHAHELATSDDRVCLFLLDEILQGTNSRERQIAVVQVLRHLLDAGAIGAISTHDLELAEDPQLKSVAETVHFRETIQAGSDGSDQMTFDYRIHQGVSPTTNALRLLEMVGL